MIGVIDTGIDYRHQAFTYEDRTTKIYSIWDQTIRDGESPEGFIYGTEYTSEQINRALAAENSLAVVPSQDENGNRQSFEIMLECAECLCELSAEGL